MKKIIAAFLLAILFLPVPVCAEELKDMAQALEQCKSYDDYEKLHGELKSMVESKKGNADTLYYMMAKTRVEELSYLARKNDIEAGRIYMSVNEKYYNEALEDLDNVSRLTKSKDMLIEADLLKFSIFKELFQQQRLDAVFDEVIGMIASYSPDKAQNLAKLNEVSKKLSDKGMADYAMKLKFVYASKVDPESAKMLAEDIKSNGDKYVDEGNIKEALSTYDTYLKLAENYYEKDVMAGKLMDIAEKYFGKNRFKDAIKYYSIHLQKYGDSKVADYASYKLALSYFNDKDYATAIGKFEDFLKNYQNSVWFEKGFEELCRLYYETSETGKALENLQKLIEAYPRQDSRDYAYLLTAILFYGKADYDKALDVLRKMQQEFPKSSYYYVTETLIMDINEIKKGAAPSYSFGANDLYRIWEPYTSLGVSVTVGEGAQAIDNKDAKPGETFVKTKCGANVAFNISGIEDLDRYNEYWQDKEDQSRLPREIKTGTEKDLVFFTWSCPDNGKFLDEKQLSSRTWQAPELPGDYIININAGDIALVRPPDSGSRKDPLKTLTIHVTAEK
ncbi:MAG: tetratricopeptide repeat protein [Candidatus Omnitrophota bacterium]|jgi:tetratricopeptide (TPR) repeat protein